MTTNFGKTCAHEKFIIPVLDNNLLQNVVTLLTQTLNPSSQRQAEEGLKGLELITPQFPQLLLAIAEGGFVVLEIHVRMAAALLFKNFVKRHWPMESVMASFTEMDRASLRANIVKVLTRVPPAIQNQLCETVTLIAAVDFPEAWPDLLQQLVQRLNPADFDNNIVILRTLHRMFKRYRTEFRSDELYTEINYVMAQLGAPLLEMYKATCALVEANSTNRAPLLKILKSQVLLNKIYYSLSAQDLPAFFEDHLVEFMDLMKKQLTFNNPVAASTADDEAGPAEKLPASVVKVATLYAMRYEEDFSMLGQFVEAAWGVLTTISRASKYDATVGACMKLLSIVAKQERQKSLFSGVLQLLCDKVIVPNTLLRESDLEQFEDEPLEYIRRSVEGATDEDGRREGAIALARGLMEFYESEVTAILQSYVEEFLKIYATAPAQKWRDKNAAVTLFTAIAIRGSVSALGVTRVNPLLNIQDFFTRHVLSDLQPANAALHPLLKVDAIKFLFDFRSQLDKEQLMSAFPLIQHHLASQHPVVHTYAAIAIDKILAVKRSGNSIFTPADVAPFSGATISAIIKMLQMKRRAERISENEFIIKALLRMFITGQQDVLLPVIDESLECICNLISLVAMNPSNPIFNHSLFECAATLVKFCGGTAAGAAKINTKFVPVLQGILQNDVADFIHYVFQLLAILVEVCNESALPIVVQPLVAPTLLPALWSSSENIPALTRFLQACIVKDPNFFVMSGMLPQLLGIFQTLISSKVHDIHAFALLDALVQSVAATHLESYMSGIMMVILKRLQVNKSPRLALNFLLFLCVFLVAATSFPQPPSYLIRLLDGMQPKLLALVLSTQLLPHAPKIRDRHDRKLAILGLTKLATECPELLAGDADYAVLFGNLVGTIVVMLTTLPAGGLGDIQSEEVSEEEPAGTFWKLRVAPAPRRCPSIESVVDPTVIFVNSLVTMARTRSPGSVAASLGGMDDASKNALQMLLQQANVSL